MREPAVQRIKDVRILRTRQFPEDAGPLAHPVRPESYIEINNFYTATVYEKGAEVIRMMHTLLGASGFRRGMDLYFERHDGEAATVENFVAAMEDANRVSLDQFRLWYSQAGTPVLECASEYDPLARTLALRLKQSCPPTPGQPTKQPFHIPIRLGLVDDEGNDLPLKLESGADRLAGDVLSLTKSEDVFVFVDLPSRPGVSLLRGFSAPVKLRDAASDDDLLFLMSRDRDPFNRWETGRRFAESLILRRIKAAQEGETPLPSDSFESALKRTLNDTSLNPALIAQALALPSDIELAQAMDVVDPDAIDTALRLMMQSLALALEEDLLAVYERNRIEAAYEPGAEQVGRRALRNRALQLLAGLERDDTVALAVDHFRDADNMTDAVAALSALCNMERPERDECLSAFYDRWKDDELVVNKWLTLQATSRLPKTLERVKALMAHESFDLGTPNRVRALIGGFVQGNHVRFHDPSGAGYRLAVETVLNLDPINPHVAARLLGAFESWRRYDAARRQLMQSGLRRLLDAPSLSKNVFEIASKILK